jgi:ribokinase
MSEPPVAGERRGGVAVVGSANRDTVITAHRFPTAGETVLGESVIEVAGGKGLNQALAAAAHTRCALVGCIGADTDGDALLEELSVAGVLTDHLARVPQDTGRAFVHLRPDGENSIVVVPAANSSLAAAQVHAALADLRPTVVLCQLESPLDAVEAAASFAAQHGTRLMLNASPVLPLSGDLLQQSNPLVVNVGEATALLDDNQAYTDRAGSAVRPQRADEIAAELAQRVGSVAVTDGPRGVYVGSVDAGITHVPAQIVRAVDTTGAGDCFAGTLAAHLGDGQPLWSAARTAAIAAARLVQMSRADRRSSDL